MYYPLTEYRSLALSINPPIFDIMNYNRIFIGILLSLLINPILSAQTDNNNLVWRYHNGCDWSGRIDLGGDLIGGVTSTVNGPHKIDLFGIGKQNNKLVWQYYDGSEWSGWINLGGNLKGGVSVTADGPNKLDLFAIGGNNKLIWRHYNGSEWSGWINLGGDLKGGVSVTADGPNKLDVFAIGGNNELIWRHYNGSKWSGWNNLGGDIIGSVAVTANGPHKLDVFCIGEENNELVWRQYNGSKWSGWINLGGDLVGGLAVTANGPHKLDIFSIGKDNKKLVQRHYNGSKWSGWINLGGKLSGVVAVTGGSQESKLNVFGIGKADKPWIEEIDQLVVEYDGIKPTSGERRVLLVLWDPHFPNLSKPDKETLRSEIFGEFPSVKTWFNENSTGKFKIRGVDILGWYDADMPEDWYNGQGSRDKAVAALMACDSDFDFKRYDDNRNGRIEFDELTVIIGHPGTGGGLIRIGSGRSLRDDNGDPFSIDGVILNQVAELSLGDPGRRKGLVAHELSHVLFGAGDMYISRTHTRADWYSLMDQDGQGAHLDPFHKLKAGWLDSRLVKSGGKYELETVESTGQALILYDPYGPTNEYFIIENRQRSGSHDANLLDDGLAIWHVIENKESYLNAYVPINIDLEVWNDPGNQGWGRKAVRMVRPVIEPVTSGKFDFPQRQALWDGADPITGYDLKSIDPDPSHNKLLWSNGCPSGFSILSISPASSRMSMVIEMPLHLRSK